MRIHSIAHAGGVNSIDSFTRSWQRAVGFNEITPPRRSFVVHDEAHGPQHILPDEERSSAVRDQRSLLRQQIEEYGQQLPGSVIENDDAEEDQESSDPNLPLVSGSGSPSRRVFSQHFHSPFSSSFTGTYGSMSSQADASNRYEARRHFFEQQAALASTPGNDWEPLLLRQVEEPGMIVIEVIGQSTIYQTILNSTNVLIGVGILSLPLGIRYAGWLIGLVGLSIAAVVTAYTAKLLSRCLDVDKTMITYSDIALTAFGKLAEVSIGFIFTFELLITCVALIVLFGDSLNLLIPGWGVVEFKILAGMISIPTAFIPLRYLGFSSMLGIISCFAIVVLVLVAGLVKRDSPGSLIHPAATYLFPMNWSTLPLSIGLIMSPWGGHAVFPQLYRDMRHPRKYKRAVSVAFSVTVCNMFWFKAVFDCA